MTASLPRPVWNFAGRTWTFSDAPRLMGIVNITPDSFSDGGAFPTTAAAVEHGLSLVRQGAHLLDLGGESTRPNAEPVPAGEELRRVIPVVERLARETAVPISIDTSKAAVAREALAAGASIVNDVTGLMGDPDMPAVCAASACGVIVMHMQGSPKTMQLAPRYDDVVREVRDWLAARLDALKSAGISAERIVLDPGIGFGKTPEHNLAILSGIADLRGLGRPVLIGHSRKRFLQKLLGRPLEERLAGTVGVSIALAEHEVDLLRIHDVAAVRDAITAWRMVRPARRHLQS